MLPLIITALAIGTVALVLGLRLAFLGAQADTEMKDIRSDEYQTGIQVSKHGSSISSLNQAVEGFTKRLAGVETRIDTLEGNRAMHVEVRELRQQVNMLFEALKLDYLPQGTNPAMIMKKGVKFKTEAVQKQGLYDSMRSLMGLK